MNASRTALGVAALRAAHQLLDDTPHILDDPLAVRLLGDDAVARLRAVADASREPPAIALRAHVVLRSRYAEDRLAHALARGVTQYVVLGAGLDTSALRPPASVAEVRTFVVDHPASQAFAREAIAAAGIDVPPNVTWVAADLATDDLIEVLRAHGFDDRRPAFLTCLGVLIYLEDGAADAVLRFVADLRGGSEIVFTFSPPRPDGEPSPIADAAAALGEPWRWHITEEALHLRLRELGFTDVAFVGAAELDALYTRDRRDGFCAPRRTSLVRAALP